MRRFINRIRDSLSVVKRTIKPAYYCRSEVSIDFSYVLIL